MSAELLWGLLIKGSVVIALAALAALSLRKASAARRHAVWLAAVGALFLLPVLQLPLPTWNVSPDRSPFLTPLLAPVVLRPVVKPVSLDEQPQPQLLQSTTTVVEPTEIDLVATLPWLWLGGCLLVLGWMALGYLRVAMLVRNSTPWTLEGETAKVLLSPSIRVPATAGVLRPVILLPVEATEWDEHRLRMVLAHETAHIRRRDWLWQTVTGVTCAVYFFNPLTWLAAGQLRKESEFACDDYVLGLGIEPTDYAEELLGIARSSRFELANSVGMARSKNVENRLRSIIDKRRKRNWVSGRTLVFTLGLALVLAIPVAIVRAVPDQISSNPIAPHWPAPPSIPWVPAKQVESNVFLAQNGVAGLPNGVRIKLVGISLPSGAIWGIDGKPIVDADKWRQGGVYWQSKGFHRWSHGTANMAAFGRGFIVQIQSPEDADVGGTGLIVKPAQTTKLQKLNPIYAGGDDHLPSIELKKNASTYAIIDMGIPARANTATYRYGIAANWRTVSTIANPYKGLASRIDREDASDACGIFLRDEPSVYWKEVDGDYQNKKLLEDSKLTVNEARRVVLYDREGNVVPQPENNRFDTNGYPSISLTAEMFTKIDRIELQVASYQWAEFREVPLKPDFEKEELARLDKGVRGTATGIAPGFSKKLSNGITVSIESVTKAVRDGSDWRFTGQASWRADGLVLRDSWNSIDQVMHEIPWGKLPLVHFQIGYKGASPETNTWVVAAGKSDPNFWLADRVPMNAPMLTSITTAFLPEAESGAVRVGVADGPWKILARMPVNVEKLPPLVRDDRTRTGIEMSMTDQPRFMTCATRADVPFGNVSVKGVARRFVAVLKNGEERVLKYSASGLKGVEFYALPAREGEFTANYNNLLASDVKEILLQTRPFEWVEFNGIALNPKG